MVSIAGWLERGDIYFGPNFEMLKLRFCKSTDDSICNISNTRLDWKEVLR